MVSTEAVILLLQSSGQEIMQGRVQNKWDKWSISAKMYSIQFYYFREFAIKLDYHNKRPLMIHNVPQLLHIARLTLRLAQLT